MNNRSVSTILGSIALCVLLMVAFSPAHAKKGTVKTLIGMDGFVILNTDAAGNLHTIVRMHKGDPNTTFEVGVEFNEFDGGDSTVVGTLETNRKGNTAREFSIELPADPDPDDNGKITVTVHLDSLTTDPIPVPLKN